MKYAIVLNDIVTDIIEADEQPSIGLPAWVKEIDNGLKVKIGWIKNASDLVPPQADSPDVLKQKIIDSIQFLLDSTAKTRGYDNILSLCTYAASSIPQFKLEGQAGVDWRDACWSVCYQIMTDVQLGNRPLPTVEEVLSEMPQISW